MSDYEYRSRAWAGSFRSLPAGLVVAIGLCLSFLTFFLVEDYERERSRDLFQHAALDRLASVERAIEVELDVVRAIVAFFDSSDAVDREEFRTFVTPFLERYDSIQALEWIPRVPDSERLAYRDAARAEGFADFRFTERSLQKEIVPADRRAQYFPVFFVEPHGPNKAALGFDLGSSATRLAALETARDTGRLTASGRIVLVQAAGSSAVLLFAPLFGKGNPHETAEQRRRNLAGFALGVVRIGKVVSSAYSKIRRPTLQKPAGIDLHLFDDDGKEGERLLYLHNSRDREAGDAATRLTRSEAVEGLHLARALKVGGRNWTLIARPVGAGLATGAYWQSLVALLACLAFTGVVAAYLTFLVNRTRTVEMQVRRGTGELRSAYEALRSSQERVSTVLDTVIDGIITINDVGAIESVNPAAEKIFGYESDELLGRNVKILMPEPYESAHDGYLENYRNGGQAGLIGIGREVEGRRKDGSTFPLELAVGEMWIGGVRMFTGSLRDITDRKQAEKLKREFVSTVSHELRTPLTSIKGSLGLIQARLAGDLPEKLNVLLSIAYKNSDRLVHLVNDILDIEKIEAGQMDFFMEPLDLGSLVDQAIEAHKGYGEEYQVTLVSTGDVPDGKIEGDWDRLQQVFGNLISNAAKFSPENGRVEIAAARFEKGFRFSVTDHGPGIPEEFRDRIFEKFTQADSSDTRQKGGTGLGLSITKAIVERHGGSMGFETEAGKGTTFHFDLPEWTEPSTMPVAATDGKRRHRILHIEDDPDVLRIVQAVVGNVAQAVPATRLEEARRLLTEDSFDLIILDLMLPDGDGGELLQMLTAPERRATPVIVFSAKEITRDMAKSVRAALLKSRTSNEVLLEAVVAAIGEREHAVSSPAAADG